MISTNNMVIRVAGLIDTSDVSDWENDFLKNILERTMNGTVCGTLTDRQHAALVKIYNKHFAG